MDVRGKVIIVTGGAGGIGRALCRRFAAAGAERVVVSDVNLDGARSVADEVGGTAIACDVSSEHEIRTLVEQVLDDCGRIDVFVSNAGITAKGGIDVTTEAWHRCWDINLMAHVYAARAVLPHMTGRGEGYLVQVASAAGLLTEMGSAVYSVTKHAAVALAEWLSIHYQPLGIRVSCVCPAGVATDFLNDEDIYDQFLRRSAVEPEDVAEAVIQGMRDEVFLVLPHPEVAEFFQFKTSNYDQWLSNFAHTNERLQKLAARRREK